VPNSFGSMVGVWPSGDLALVLAAAAVAAVWAVAVAAACIVFGVVVAVAAACYGLPVALAKYGI